MGRISAASVLLIHTPLNSSLPSRQHRKYGAIETACMMEEQGGQSSHEEPGHTLLALFAATDIAFYASRQLTSSVDNVQARIMTVTDQGPPGVGSGSYLLWYTKARRIAAADVGICGYERSSSWQLAGILRTTDASLLCPSLVGVIILLGSFLALRD